MESVFIQGILSDQNDIGEAWLPRAIVAGSEISSKDVGIRNNRPNVLMRA